VSYGQKSAHVICEIDYTKMDYETVLIILIFKYLSNKYHNFKNFYLVMTIFELIDLYKIILMDDQV